jgi:5-methylcytosine-specific restriction protein A
MPGNFRTDESYVAEHTTRDMLRGFLAERGFSEIVDERKSHGNTQSQIIRAHNEAGTPVALWVRLCWREGGPGHSATQIMSQINHDDWEGSISSKIERQRKRGATHLLAIQRAGNAIVYAAEIPLAAILSIWIRQRDLSTRTGLGRKNHAMNGSSPTLWLSEAVPSPIGNVLWSFPSVRDLNQLPLVPAHGSLPDDSIDDLPGVDYSTLGRDGTPRIQRITSGVPRDPRVREAVRERSKGRCEQNDCGQHRDYPGFLDVHHILGAEKNDRVWTCVALCPNCHRETHMSPDADRLNAVLLEYAHQWAPPSASKPDQYLAGVTN